MPKKKNQWNFVKIMNKNKLLYIFFDNQQITIHLNLVKIIL